MKANTPPSGGGAAAERDHVRSRREDRFIVVA
jgi:hypothetical protein